MIFYINWVGLLLNKVRTWKKPNSWLAFKISWAILARFWPAISPRSITGMDSHKAIATFPGRISSGKIYFSDKDWRLQRLETRISITRNVKIPKTKLVVVLDFKPPKQMWLVKWLARWIELECSMKWTSGRNLARNLKKNNRNVTKDSVSVQEQANHDRSDQNSKMCVFLMISWKLRMLCVSLVSYSQ